MFPQPDSILPSLVSFDVLQNKSATEEIAEIFLFTDLQIIFQLIYTKSSLQNVQNRWKKRPSQYHL